MPAGTKSFQHRANANRTSESDIPNKFKVMETIKENFGWFPLTDEILPIPDGGIADYRQPDLLITKTTPISIIELQGPIHNLDGSTVRRAVDIKKLADYKRLGDSFKVYEIWGGDKNQYPEEEVIESLKQQGLPVNEYGIKSYKERKKRCQRY